MSPRLLAPLLLLLAASACARNAQPGRVGIDHVSAPHPQARTSSVATADQNSPAQAAERADVSFVQPSPQGETNGPLISNEQIAAVLDAWYAGRIALAQQALSRAKDPGVRHHAERMLHEHVRARVHLARLGLGVSHSDLSLGLLRKAGNDLMRLRARSDPAFDQEWTALAIIDGQNFTHLLATTLVPAATQPKLYAQLRNLLPQYVADVRDQVRILANLEVPLDEQRELQREAAAPPPSPAARARAQGGTPRTTAPRPAPAPDPPPEPDRLPNEPLLPR